MAYLFELLTSFHGRISRRSWWLGLLVVGTANSLGGLLLNPEFLTEDLPPPSWPDSIWQLALLFPLPAITVKRFNDRDRPGWLGYAFAAICALVYLAPHARAQIGSEATPVLLVVLWSSGAFLLFVFVDNGLLLGTQGPNRFGPDPLQTSEAAP